MSTPSTLVPPVDARDGAEGTRIDLGTVRECEELGIRRAGMHRGPGHGSVSEKAAAFGREHGMTVIDGGCPCMFAPTDDSGHKVMRAIFTLTGNVPRRVP